MLGSGMRPDLLNTQNDEEPAMPDEWWGPVWSRPSPIGLGELIRSGLLPLDLASLLWVLIDRNASIIVAAGPSGAGKSTLLTALLDLLPGEKQRFHTRGMYESFDVLAPATPGSWTILVNEISPHLPIYVWGDAARRLFELGDDGFQFFAACHAESVEEFAYSLCAYPLRIPSRLLNAVDALIFLQAWREGEAIARRIAKVVSLRADERRGVKAILLWDGAVDLNGVATAFSLDERALEDFEADRSRRLEGLRARFEISDRDDGIEDGAAE